MERTFAHACVRNHGRKHGTYSDVKCPSNKVSAYVHVDCYVRRTRCSCGRAVASKHRHKQTAVFPRSPSYASASKTNKFDRQLLESRLCSLVMLPLVVWQSRVRVSCRHKQKPSSGSISHETGSQDMLVDDSRAWLQVVPVLLLVRLPDADVHRDGAIFPL